MPFATGAQTSCAFILESTWGTTPATPELTLFPVTRFSGKATKDIYESKDIRGDRQVADLRHGFQGSMFDFDLELKHGQFDWLLESALWGTFSANVLKGGTTRRSYTLEARHADIAVFKRFTGAICNSLNLKIGTDGMVTGKASMMAKQMTVAGTTIDNAGGYTAPTAKSSMSAFQATITEGGSAIASVTSVDLTIDNGLEPSKVVGSNTAPEMFSGRQRVTGTLAAYFETTALLNKFLNETSSSLVLGLSDGTNTLTLTLPTIKYTGGEAPVDGESGIVLNLPFQALFNAGEATSIRIQRS
jgi:hypothetical protein